MVFLVAGLINWVVELVSAHPWLLLIALALVVAVFVLGRDPQPRQPRPSRRVAEAQMRAREQAAYERRSAELDQAYRETKDRIRRIPGQR